MTIDQPLRRRRGRRAHDDLKTRIGEHIDGPVQPVPLIVTRRGFDPAPCKFSNPDAVDAKRLHARRIVFPHRFGPVLRVITDAKTHTVRSYAKWGMAADVTAKPSSVKR